MPASAANLVIYDASAVPALGPKLAAICLCIASAFMAACLAASAKTFSVSTFASSTDSSIPVAKCCAGWAAGADDDDDDDAAADDGVDDGGPNVRAGPAGDGPIACGCPRGAGFAEFVRGGPRVDGCAGAGGFTNVCPWCGPG